MGKGAPFRRAPSWPPLGNASFVSFRQSNEKLGVVQSWMQHKNPKSAISVLGSAPSVFSWPSTASKTFIQSNEELGEIQRRNQKSVIRVLDSATSVMTTDHDTDTAEELAITVRGKPISFDAVFIEWSRVLYKS